jgi:hypothetical protein
MTPVCALTLWKETGIVSPVSSTRPIILLSMSRRVISLSWPTNFQGEHFAFFRRCIVTKLSLHIRRRRPPSLGGRAGASLISKSYPFATVWRPECHTHEASSSTALVPLMGMHESYMPAPNRSSEFLSLVMVIPEPSV